MALLPPNSRMLRLRRLAQTSATCRPMRVLPVALTKTEIRVLVLLGSGMSNKEIAAKMECSVKTIKNHPNAIFQKLGVSNRTEAVVKGIEMGLISPEEPN